MDSLLRNENTLVGFRDGFPDRLVSRVPRIKKGLNDAGCNVGCRPILALGDSVEALSDFG